LYCQLTDMKKIILVLVCIYCCIILCHGQNAKIDSLLKVLESSKEDTAKVNTLNRIASEFRNNNPDTAIYFANQAHSLAFKLNDKMGIANSCLIFGSAFKNLGNYEMALNNCDSALIIYEQLLQTYTEPELTAGKLKILKQQARAYNGIAIINDLQNNYPEALKNNLNALKIREEISDKEGMAASYNNIGLVYENMGNYPEALKNYYASLEIAEENGFKQSIGIAYHNLGSIYDGQRNYPEALKNYFASLKISDELGDRQGVSNNYNNIGTIYFNQGNYPEALKNFLSGLKINDEIGNEYGKGVILINIGKIYKMQGNFSEALKNYFDSKKIMEELGNLKGIAKIYHSIADVYVEQDNYNEASHWLNKALSVSDEIGNLQMIMSSSNSLAWVDSTQGNFKKSLEHYKMYVAAHDSLDNQEVAQKLTQLQMQYEFDKKEALAKHEQDEKDALALKELQRQKLIRDFALGTIGLVLVLFFFIYRSYRARQSLRLNDIRNRIAGDLHDDIGSTLNSISIYSEVARKKDEHYDEALEMIGDASRKIIEAMSDIVWTINAENDSFEKIIFRMKSLAYNLFRAKKIEFTFHSDETLSDKKLSLEERRNFYLIFKEAVNNMVKYSSATRAAISLTYDNNRIRLRIQDNGVGFNTSQENAGNGLKNMKRRADEMKAGFKIESQPGSGTQIELILKV
jgi:signal transduction histidine kinase